MSSIIGISTVSPAYKYTQEELCNFMTQVSGIAGTARERRMKALYANSGIKYRYSVLPDFSGNDFLLFDPEFNSEPSVEKRMELFARYAPELAADACKKVMAETITKSGKPIEPSDITHLITVSCTGLSAPGIELQVSSLLGLNDQVTRFTVNFMGCYAVFPALKIADAICRSDEKATVLIVSAELCTLHFQNRTDDDTLRANALFSDGAAAVLVAGNSKSRREYRKSMKLDAFRSQIISSGSTEMTWGIGKSGFLMKLSSYIPGIISEQFGPAIQNIKPVNGEEINYWAVHPGGKRILDLCRQSLQLNGHLDPSYKVLSEYGNMSSATVFYVMEDIWKSHIKWGDPGKLVAAGFGPGLTMETSVMSPES